MLLGVMIWLRLGIVGCCDSLVIIVWRLVRGCCVSDVFICFVFMVLGLLFVYISMLWWVRLWFSLVMEWYDVELCGNW